MLRRRSSAFSVLYSNKSKTSSKPTSKPGRTLVLSSTSSTFDLNATSENSSPDCSPFTIDTSFPNEPLFEDFYLPSDYIPQRPPTLPTLLENQTMSDYFSPPPQPSTVTFSEDFNNYDYSSDDEDDILDSYCSTPPDDSYLATQVTVVYSGRARLIDIFPLRHSYKQPPPPLPPQSISRRSSASTRDNSISLSSPLSSRSSGSDSRSSPASSISEYSNLICETIPENKAVSLQSQDEVDMKPFRRGHPLNLSSSPAFSMNYLKQPQIGIMELQSSSNSSLTKLDTAFTQWEAQPRLTSFFSDTSSPDIEADQHDYWP